MNQGIGYVSEDRKNEGILAVRSILENMGIGNMHRLGKHFHIRKQEEIREVEKQIHDLDIKTTGRNQRIENLSGGNQPEGLSGEMADGQPESADP